MDRTCFAILFLGLALFSAERAPAADKAVDKDLPYSFVVVDIVPEDVGTAVDYCKSHGVAEMGILGEIVSELSAGEFSEFDLTQPVRFEMCVSSAGNAIQLVAFAGTKQTVTTLTSEDLSVVPDCNGLFRGPDEDEDSQSFFVRFDKDRCYLAVGEGDMTIDVADRLLTRLKREDKHNPRFQWSISSRPCEINPPMRKLWLKALTRSTSVQLQQRDDEDDLSYQLRSFWGKTRLAMMNTFAADCEFVEAGFAVDPDEEHGTMEFTIRARENSTLDRWMTKTGKASSPFAGMLQGEDRTGLALSFELGETQKESLKALTAAATDGLIQSDLPSNEADALSQMIDEQIKHGEFHAYVQFEGTDSSSPFSSLSGGISLKNSQAIVPVLNHVATMISRAEPSLQVGHAEDNQPAVHLINASFGTSEKSTLAFTANSHGIWFALGEETRAREKSLDARERLLSLIADVQQSRQSRERGYLLQSFVSQQDWSSISRALQLDSSGTETRVETYMVVVTNADGTTRTEQRSRTVQTQTTGGFKKSTAAEVTDGDKAGTTIQQVAATEEEKPNKKKYGGQIRLSTESVKNGLRIRGKFEQSAIAGLFIFPGLIGVVFEQIGME